MENRRKISVVQQAKVYISLYGKKEGMNKDTQKRKANGPASGSLKEIEKKRRQVFKPVLDNPYTQSQWPLVEPDIAKSIIELVTVLLEPIGKHQKLIESKPQIKPDVPEITKYVTIGFNSTVSSLEYQAKENTTDFKVKKTSKKQLSKKTRINYVLVCRNDITPSLLTQHFPVLSFTSSSEGSHTKLIQLPKNSMNQLSNAVGKPHTGIIGMSADFPGASALSKIIDEHIDDVSVPWLQEHSKFYNINLKLLKTTAPIIKKNDQKKKIKGNEKK